MAEWVLNNLVKPLIDGTIYVCQHNICPPFCRCLREIFESFSSDGRPTNTDKKGGETSTGQQGVETNTGQPGGETGQPGGQANNGQIGGQTGRQTDTGGPGGGTNTGESSSGARTLSARALEIEHADKTKDTDHWKWNKYPSEPRFAEVAELLKVWHFEIKTSMNFLGLSANTQYGAYLIFKRKEDSEGLHVIMNTSVSVVGRKPETKYVCLTPTSATPASVGRPEARLDGWLELELGKFHCDIVTNKDAVIIIQETKRMDIKKAGLIVAGIEIRAVN